ncbi:MAG TPA: divalent cation tolerance protein CutA [Methylocystis sp.]|nr:divalent cation tolerance protein CutA [Methylocystis sp.]
MAESYSIVLTTTGSEAKAREIAAAALEARLAACVQSWPISSRYVWRGELREEPEILLQFKIASHDYEALLALIRGLHDYEVPEILRVAVADGDRAYLAWVSEATRKA